MVGSILDLRFEPHFWEDMDEIFGPILRPILEPIWNALQDTYFRAYLLSALIWTCIIIGGMVYLVLEGLPILGIFGDTEAPAASVPQRRRAVSARQEDTSEIRRQEAAVRATKERERREKEVVESGVRVISRVKKRHEHLVLTVTVSNQSDFKIDMVVIDLDLPEGIDTTIGSFRMQRLGSITTGETKSASFALQSKGGAAEKIAGHVEFLSASYEITKIPLPKPEVTSE